MDGNEIAMTNQSFLHEAEENISKMNSNLISMSEE